MKSFKIGANDAGTRLDRFISKVAPAMPQSLMYKYIRTKRIKINGKRASPDARLCEGSEISIYANDEFFAPDDKKFDFLSASKNLSVVFEDENLLIADKPQGLLVHPDKNEYGDTLISRIQRYLYEKGEFDPKTENSFRPALAHRIDRNTGGLVLAAKNAETLRVLCEKIKAREIDKYYLAVVHGTPSPREGTLTGYLSKDCERNLVSVHAARRDGDKTIKTKYRVLSEKDGLSLLEIELLTGRTHQIRAHLSSIGHPLLGDGKYGKNAADRKRGFKGQALYAYRLRFSFKTDAGLLNYLKDREFYAPNVWFADELFKDLK